MAITLAHAGETTVTLNDGTNYFVQNRGVNLGQPQTTWEEVENYASTANTQVNVHAKKGLIAVSIPMMVKGSSVSDLLTKLQAIWDLIDACTYDSPGTLTWDTESFNIVYSTRPQEIERDPQFQLGFMARFTMVLMRKP